MISFLFTLFTDLFPEKGLVLTKTRRIWSSSGRAFLPGSTRESSTVRVYTREVEDSCPESERTRRDGDIDLPERARVYSRL